MQLGLINILVGLARAFYKIGLLIHTAGQVLEKVGCYYENIIYILLNFDKNFDLRMCFLLINKLIIIHLGNKVASYSCIICELIFVGGILKWGVM